MSTSLFESDRVVRWVVCPGSSRWLRAVRCFAGAMIPDDCQVSVIAAEPAEHRQQLLGQRQAVVLWDITAENLGASCEWIAKTAIESPTVLQIAAVTELSVREQAALSELGVVVMIRHPEELPKLGKMIGRYLSPERASNTSTKRQRVNRQEMG